MVPEWTIWVAGRHFFSFAIIVTPQKIGTKKPALQIAWTGSTRTAL
jgi:hypothetical protein